MKETIAHIKDMGKAYPTGETEFWVTIYRKIEKIKNNPGGKT